MKIVTRLWVILVIMCSAFGASAQHTAKNLNIVFIGNSITYGANLDSPKTQAPPVVAAKYLSGRKGIGKVNYSNQGHSGYTTLDFALHTVGFEQVENAARAFHDQNALLIFSIDLGTNDSAIKGPNGSPVPPKEFPLYLMTMLDGLLSDFPGSIVIIHHPIWYSPNTYNGAMYLQEGLSRLQAYFPKIDSLSIYYQQTGDRDRVFTGDTKAFDYFKKNYLTDLTPEEGHQGTFYLHPNAKGGAALGTFWAQAIYNIVTGLK